MARYPSGIAGDLPDDPDIDVRARIAQMLLAVDGQPIGQTAPCANPECCGPVDFLPGAPPVLYCSTTCRARTAKLRARARQQVDALERLLRDSKHARDVPRGELRERAARLRWWLNRLPSAGDDVVSEP